MIPPQRSTRCLALMLVCWGAFFVNGALGQTEKTPAEQLNDAVQLFHEGDYIAAHHALKAIDPEKLSAEDQTRHAEYSQRATLAVAMYEKAEADYDAAQRAVGEGRLSDASELYKAVIDNRFGDKDTRARAASELRDLRASQPESTTPNEDMPTEAPPAANESAAPASENENAQPMDAQEGTGPPAEAQPAETQPGEGQPAEAQPAEPQLSPAEQAKQEEYARQLRALRASVLFREANEAMDKGRYSEAQGLYQKVLELVPGHPESVDALERIKQHGFVEGEPGSLIERIQERNRIAWQRVVATFRSAERDVREHVLADHYEQARRSALRAGQIIEGGRAFADPASDYGAMKHEAEKLLNYVEDEERRYNENQIREDRDKAVRQNKKRIQRVEEQKRERVSALMNQALQHRKNEDYDAAISAVKQVLAIDPTNDNARWFQDELEDRRSYSHQQSLREEFYKQSQGVLEDVESSKIPWWREITYPKNWREIINRPTRTPPGSEHERGIDANLQSRLNMPMRIEFDGDPFKDAIDMLAEKTETNITVAWKDLADASVMPDAPVNLKLRQEVPFRTALQSVLDQVGGSRVELGYLPVDGVIKVATQDMLDRYVFEEVYDVNDLLMPIPNFDDAPTMDLKDPGTFVVKDRGYTPAGVDRPLFSEDEREAVKRQMESEANTLVALIRKTIEPQSWRETGGDIASITEINGQLVITQTPTGHSRVGGLLARLREQRAIQIAVEARFITVQSNYLEELGLDLDIFLNSGNAGFDYVPGAGGTRVVDPVLGSQLLLPRSFSRYGFTPAAPGVGNTLATGTPNPLNQPFIDPATVPGRGNAAGGSGNTTPIPFVNNILEFTDPARLTSDLPGSFAGNPTLQPALSIFGSFLDNIQVDFLVRATQADSRTTLLTAPRLVLFNGQRAWVAVVNQQSFVSSLEPIIDAQGQAPDIQTVETGAVLDAQATVSADRRYVTLTLRPSVGRLLGIQTFEFSLGPGGSGQFVQLPNISRQVVRTTVSVPDGGTLLIGGQKVAGEIEVESGVPILSKIPILKRLYSSTTKVKDEQVLLILIKPKIIIPVEAEMEAFPTFGSAG